MDRLIGGLAVGTGATFVAVTLASIPAYLTHIVVMLMRIFNGSSDDAAWSVAVLIGGALIAPIGVVHGWLIWFGLA